MAQIALAASQAPTAPHSNATVVASFAATAAPIIKRRHSIFCRVSHGRAPGIRIQPGARTHPLSGKKGHEFKPIRHEQPRFTFTLHNKK